MNSDPIKSLPFRDGWAQKQLCRYKVPQIVDFYGDFFSKSLVYAQYGLNITQSLGAELSKYSLCTQTIKIHVVPLLRKSFLCPTTMQVVPFSKLFPAVSKEALSADLLCIGEDHERVRIDFRDQLPQDDSLLLGDGDQKNRSVLAGIHARSG